MTRAIKSYWAFTNPVYRLVMWIVLPAVFILVTIFSHGVEFTDEVDVPLLGLMLSLYMADTMADFWFMGGFYARNNGSLEFMQSSNRFQPFVQDVAMVDSARRGLLYISLALLGAWIGRTKGYAMDWYQMFSYLPLLELFLAQFVVVVGRHFVMWNHVYICAMTGFAGIVVLIPVCAAFSFHHPIVVNAVLGVLAVLAGGGTVLYTRRKVRDSFYDK